MTEEEIDRSKTPNGGWTKAQLAAWGVPWPPPKGWKHRLIDDRRSIHWEEARQLSGMTQPSGGR